MPITRPPYSPEFRQQIIDLARAGRDPVSLSKEFEPTAETIRKWVAASTVAQPAMPTAMHSTTHTAAWSGAGCSPAPRLRRSMP